MFVFYPERMGGICLGILLLAVLLTPGEAASEFITGQTFYNYYFFDRLECYCY